MNHRVRMYSTQAYMYDTLSADYWELTLFILLSVQASATFLAIFTTSSLSLAMRRAVLMKSFFEASSPPSPLQKKLISYHQQNIAWWEIFRENIPSKPIPKLLQITGLHVAAILYTKFQGFYHQICENLLFWYGSIF